MRVCVCVCVKYYKYSNLPTAFLQRGKSLPTSVLDKKLKHLTVKLQ